MYRGPGYLNGKPYHGTSNRDNGGCLPIAAIIIPLVLGNIAFIYIYFWGLNDDSLFSTDDLWRTFILGFWIFEFVGLLCILFNIFTGKNY